MRFSVDLDDLAAATARMDRFEQRLAIRLDDLDATVARLHLSWTGTAALAHDEAHERWTRGARDMHAALAAMTDAARRAGDCYQLTADTNTRMWGDLT